MEALKEYLIIWLLNNIGEDVFVMFDANHSKVIFPFDKPSSGFFVARIRYVENFIITPEGMSFLACILPITGEVFIPMESICMIRSETGMYEFGFNLSKPAPPPIEKGRRLKMV